MVKITRLACSSPHWLPFLVSHYRAIEKRKGKQWKTQGKTNIKNVTSKRIGHSIIILSSNRIAIGGIVSGTEVAAEAKTTAIKYGAIPISFDKAR